MASYRGRRRAPARPRLAKDQQETDYASIEIITADDFKEGAVAELTPPGAHDSLSGGTDSYTRSPSAYETLMPSTQSVEDEVEHKAKAALQPQYVQPRQTPARKQAPLPKPATPVNEYGRTPSAEIRLAPVARRETPVPPQQNFATAPVSAQPVPAAVIPVIPVAKPVTATSIDDTEITKVHSRADIRATSEREIARVDSSDDYGIEEVSIDAAPALSDAKPVQPVFERLHSDDDGDECSAVAIPGLDQLNQRQIETEELPVFNPPRVKQRSALFVPLVLVFGICIGYLAATWQNYVPFYSTLVQDLFPTQAALSDEELAPSVDTE